MARPVGGDTQKPVSVAVTSHESESPEKARCMYEPRVCAGRTDELIKIVKILDLRKDPSNAMVTVGSSTSDGEAGVLYDSVIIYDGPSSVNESLYIKMDFTREIS